MFFCKAERWTGPDFKSWDYSVVDGEAILTGDPNVRSGEVFIPSVINGYSVVGIAENVFKKHSRLTSVVIPDTVREIDVSAFEGCTALSNVVIGAGVKTIASTAFWGCENIKSVTFKSVPSVRHAGVVTGDWILESENQTYHEAVYRCPKVQSYGTAKMQYQVIITGNYGYTRLQWRISDNMSQYAKLSIYVDGEKQSTRMAVSGTGTDGRRWQFIDMDSLSKGVHTISWEYLMEGKVAGGGDAWVTVDTPVSQVMEPTARNLFPDSYDKIEHVTLTGSVLEVHEHMFEDCTSLSRITFGESVRKIWFKAFYHCESLNTVVFPESIRYIDRDAFGYCSSLRSIYLEGRVAPTLDVPVFWSWLTPYDEYGYASGVIHDMKVYVKSGTDVYDFWRSNISIVYLVHNIKLESNGGVISETNVTVDIGRPYGGLPVPEREGYLFDGWYTAREGGEKVLASDIPTEDTTLYAHWTIIPYTITYSELYGSANPNPAQYTVEDSVSFGALENRSGRKFVGWSPASIPLGSVGDVNVTALWQDVGVNNVLGETASTGGDEDWFVSWDGANPILRSGAIVKKQSSWMEISFEDAARVSFEWKASCEDLGGASERTDGVTVEIDGVEAGFICGETGWIAATNLVSGEGTHKIRWTYSKDAKTDVGEDCAWVRNVTVTPLRSASFDAGGAEAGVALEAISAYVGDRYALPDNGSLKKARHSFVGWQFGDDVFAAGTWCVMPSSNVIYAAVWSAKVLDAPCITAPVTYDEESTLVSISAAEGTTIYYTLDGSVPSANNGTQYVGAFRATGTVKVMAVAVRDDWYDSTVAQMTTTRSWTTLEDSLGVDDEEFTITTGGTANWIGDKANACVKSAGDGWLKAAFVGPCVVAWEERTGTGNWSAMHRVFAEEGVGEITWEGASLFVRGLQRLVVRRVDFACGEGVAGEVPQGTCPVSIYDAAGFPFELPSADGLSVPKHRFVGWRLGEAVFAVGAQCVMPTYDVTYVGVWEVKKLSAPVIDVASRYSTEKTVFSVSQQEGATVYYTLDGSDPSSEHGLRYSGVVEIEGSVTIRAIAVCDDWFASEVSSASTVRLPWSASECLNAADLTFEFSGDADWKRDLQESHDGVASMQSGTIGNYQKSEVRTTVTGSGELSFWCRASSECDESDGEPYDGMMVYVDDVVQGDLIGGNIQWTNVRLKVSGEATHVVRWVYEKDKSGSGGRDCVWLDEVAWNPMLKPIIEGDEGATVTGDTETGFVIKPSEGKTAVEVTIPQGVDAAKVTVEVSTKVASVKLNGAKVKIVSGGVDITEFLNVPAADGKGVVDLTKATVKEEVVKEAMDVEKGAKIVLDAANPSLTTPNTRVGLFYQLREGTTLGGMANGDSAIGDGNPWTPEIKVKGGKSAFYSIDVGKGE